MRTLLRRLLLRITAWCLRPAVRPTAPGFPPRVLLLRPDHLGDVLLTAPAVALLRERLPGVMFTYLVGPWSVEVARHGPLGDQVRPLAFPGFTRQAKRSALEPYVLLWREARRLRTEQYDAAVLLRPDHWWGALLALAAGIPLRIGYGLPDMRPLLTHALPPAPTIHAAEQALTLARAVVDVLAATSGYPSANALLSAGASVAGASVAGASGPGQVTASAAAHHAAPPLFTTTADEERAAEQFLARHALGQAPFVVLHPSAGAALKSWPVERWAAIANVLRQRGLAVVLSGGSGDADLLDRIEAGLQARPAARLLAQPVGVVAAVYRRGAIVIGPDNGPLHLAAAVGTPTVRLYGPAPAAVYGPWPPDADQRVLQTRTLACVPCGYLESPPCGAAELPPCMLALSITEVLHEVNAALLAAGRTTARA